MARRPGTVPDQPGTPSTTRLRLASLRPSSESGPTFIAVTIASTSASAARATSGRPAAVSPPCDHACRLNSRPQSAMPQLPKENVKLADQELNEVLARIGGRTHLSPTAARPHSSDDPDAIARDIAAISRIEAVPSLLQVLCDTTGMGFAAVARVTGGTWIACAVRDTVSFGLKPGGQLPLETTLCTEVRQSRNADSAGKPRTHLRALLSPLDIREPRRPRSRAAHLRANRPRLRRPPRRRLDGGFRHALHRANSAARHARCGLIARTMAHGNSERKRNGMTFASSGGRNARTGGR